MKTQTGSLGSLEYWDEARKSRSAALESVDISSSESKVSHQSGMNSSAVRWVSRIRGWAWLTIAILGRLFQVSLIRRVAPGRRSLERHEFESVEMRRGGFGNVL